MISQFEGIVLYKTMFKDKDLIVHLLDRTGKKFSILCYGAKSRNSKRSFSTIELGYMLKVTLKESSKKNLDMAVAKEWDIIWSHSKISPNYDLYCYMCFLLEVTSKISPQSVFTDDGNCSDSQGIFNVLSNALFYLNEITKASVVQKHMMMFLGKLLFHQGVFPDVESCVYCESRLSENIIANLDVDAGGFGCLSCKSDLVGRRDPVPVHVWKSLLYSISNKFIDYDKLDVADMRCSKILLDYFCHHNQLSVNDLKSISFLYTKSL